MSDSDKKREQMEELATLFETMPEEARREALTMVRAVSFVYQNMCWRENGVATA